MKLIGAEAENNSMTITTNGTTHPAWGTWYDLASNTATQMEVTSNTFCACGAYMADGRMAVFGGNQPVTYGGAAVDDTGANPTGANPYDDGDGGAAIRVLSPCDGGACNWQEGGDSLTMYVSIRCFAPVGIVTDKSGQAVVSHCRASWRRLAGDFWW